MRDSAPREAAFRDHGRLFHTHVLWVAALRWQALRWQALQWWLQIVIMVSSICFRCSTMRRWSPLLQSTCTTSITRTLAVSFRLTPWMLLTSTLVYTATCAPRRIAFHYVLLHGSVVLLSSMTMITTFVICIVAFFLPRQLPLRPQPSRLLPPLLQRTRTTTLSCPQKSFADLLPA